MAREHEPIVISGTGMQILTADEAWRKYCKETNLLNPYSEIDKVRNQFYHYTQDPDYKGVTHIKVDNMNDEAKERIKELNEMKPLYDFKRRKWIGQYILDKYGYNSLMMYASYAEQKADGGFQEWYLERRPCEGPDKECSLFCPIFTECEEIISGNN